MRLGPVLSCCDSYRKIASKSYIAPVPEQSAEEHGAVNACKAYMLYIYEHTTILCCQCFVRWLPVVAVALHVSFHIKHRSCQHVVGEVMLTAYTRALT